jgi:hypothetical protein
MKLMRRPGDPELASIKSLDALVADRAAWDVLDAVV